MHPAPSIIAFTVLSGLGYGLAFMLGLGLLDPAAISTKAAHVAAIGLIGAGLLASVLHLGNPQRFLWALTQWRSSWLSREGVMALITFVPLLLAAWASIFHDSYWLSVGLAGSLGAGLTVYCTSMIYGSLKSIDAWHTGWTVVCYLLFALAGGLLASALIAAVANNSKTDEVAVAAIAAVVAAWAAKWRWRQRLANPPTSTAETATGLGYLGRVRQFEPPHMMANYLTNEMGFRVARKHAAKLSGVAIGLGGVLPVLMLVLALASSSLAAPALAIGLAGYIGGVFVERWLFFAEARHSVMSYYGS